MMNLVLPRRKKKKKGKTVFECRHSSARMPLSLACCVLFFFLLGAVGAGIGVAFSSRDGGNSDSNSCSVPSSPPTTTVESTPTPSPSTPLVDEPTIARSTPTPTTPGRVESRTLRPTSTASSTGAGISSWMQIGSTLNGVATGDEFGNFNALALSSDGTILAVGASNNDDVATNAGHVQVFQRSGGTEQPQAAEWQPVGAALTGVAAGDQFGSSVALSSNGQIIAVGAEKYSVGGPGYVRVYEYDSINDKWNARGSIIEGDGADYEFGSSVALSLDGNTLAVSAPAYDGGSAGRVRVFAFDSNSNEWVQQGSTLTGVAASDWFGWSLDLSADGGILAVGDPSNDDNGSYSGNVRAFQFNSNSNEWDPLGEAIPGVAKYDEFGISLALSSNGMVLAAGADGNGDNGYRSGHVRVFDYKTSSNQWIQRGSVIVGVAVGDQFGSSVALSADGNQVAAGAYLNYDIAHHSGHVRVFHYEASSGGTSTTGQWKQVGAALTGVGGRSDYFGSSVAMSADGSVVAGGATESSSDVHFEGPGYVCVYEGVVE